MKVNLNLLYLGRSFGDCNWIKDFIWTSFNLGSCNYSTRHVGVDDFAITWTSIH
jgi:hypothetical protein